jgi:hypothetical protein
MHAYAAYQFKIWSSEVLKKIKDYFLLKKIKNNLKIHGWRVFWRISRVAMPGK